MAKELPYFQFEPAEYLTKDISFCSLSAQGLFINLCAYYWQRGCKITKTQFLKRLNNEKEFTELLEEGVFDLDNDGNISVGFLDIQFMSIEEQQKENSTRGKIGNLKRWNIDAYNKFMSKELTLEEALKLPKVSGSDRGATPKVSGDDDLAIAKEIADKRREEKKREDKIKEDKRKERIVKCKADFKKSLSKYLDKYGRDILNEFFNYWTEHGDNDIKMRFEKEKSFAVHLRLGRWKKSSSKQNYKDEAVTTVNKRVSTIKIG
jgi:hypothetical protein